METTEKITLVKEELQEKHALECESDYSIIHTHNEIFITVTKPHKETVACVCYKYELKVTKWFIIKIQTMSYYNMSDAFKHD